MPYVIAGIIVVVIFSFILSGYVKASPDTAYIISGIRIKGMAEAGAIKAKALNEAEGIGKKAEAMAEMGQAVIMEMPVNLPIWILKKCSMFAEKQ